MGETIWNGFAICGIFWCLVLAWMIILAVAAEIKDWYIKRKKKKPLPEPLATLVAVDDDVDKYYICIKCPKDKHHFSRLLSYLDVSEYAARCRTEVKSDGQQYIHNKK